MEDLDLSRRDFVQTTVVGLATLPGTVQAQVQQENPDSPRNQREYQGVAVLEGPRDARPTIGGDFFKAENREVIYYAYRYIDEVTKASWYTTQDLDAWHPEPVGAADVETSNGSAHSVSIVNRDGSLFLRRY